MGKLEPTRNGRTFDSVRARWKRQSIVMKSLDSYVVSRFNHCRSICRTENKSLILTPPPSTPYSLLLLIGSATAERFREAADSKGRIVDYVQIHSIR